MKGLKKHTSLTLNVDINFVIVGRTEYLPAYQQYIVLLASHLFTSFNSSVNKLEITSRVKKSDK